MALGLNKILRNTVGLLSFGIFVFKIYLVIFGQSCKKYYYFFYFYWATTFRDIFKGRNLSPSY